MLTVYMEQVGPRTNKDRERFPPNNILLMLAGAGLLWMGWSGFNGGGPFAANTDASLASLNTHVCTATSLLTWLLLDIVFFGNPSVIGATQGMITGLVCITPAAGNITPIYITIHLFLPFLAIIICKLILIFSRPLSFGNIGSNQLNFLRD
jgi:ammonia channel protein AmtB